MLMDRESASFTVIASAMHALPAEMSARLARVAPVSLASLRSHDVRSRHTRLLDAMTSIDMIDGRDVISTSITRAI